MLTLNLKTQPYWLDLPHGVRVQVMPARATMMEAVRDELFGALEDDSEAPEGASTYTLNYVKAVARHAILAWEGVCDEGGKEIPPSPDYVDALIEDSVIYVAFRDRYVLPTTRVAEEGNA